MATRAVDSRCEKGSSKTMTTEEIRSAIEKAYPGLVIKEQSFGSKNAPLYLTAEVPRKGLRHAHSIYAVGTMKKALLSIAKQLNVEIK